MKRNNTRDLVTISVAFFFAFLGAGASQPFVVSYLSEQRGFSLAQASLVLSTVYFTFAVFRFLIGFVIDAVGLHRAKILGVVTYALFPLVICRVRPFPILLCGSVIWGIGAAMLWTSSLVQVMNTSPATRYATATGIVRGTVMLAVFLGAYILSHVYARLGYEAVFLAAALLGLCAIFAMMLSPSREVDREKPDLRKFLKVMQSHETKAVVALLVCSGLAYGLLLNGFKSHIEVQCGKDWLKLILPFFFLAGILSNYLGGWISDRAGRWKTFAWGFAIGAAGMLMAWAFTDPVLLTLAMFFIGIQFAIVPLSAFAWVGDKTTPADRASVMGYVFCFRDLGVALAIQMRGAISEVPKAFLVFGVVSVLCACVAFLVDAFAPQEAEAAGS